MIKVENIDVWGFEHAIRGMRNPMNSWAKSDSYMCDETHCYDCQFKDTERCAKPDGFYVGPNDLDLMKRLYKGGHPHRKYLRQIMVSMDITAPLYWWKEFDTYKVGTTANSCSTMHKIMSKPFDINDFSHEHVEELTGQFYNSGYQWWVDTIKNLNYWRDKYLLAKKIDDIVDGDNDTLPSAKIFWWQVIQMLPSSYNQKRTVTITYENIMNMLDYRDPHKLDEWNYICAIFKSLPYVKEIRG